MASTLRALATAVLVLVALQSLRAADPRSVQGAKRISAADAAPFVGEWALALQGPNGPAAFTLSIGVQKETVTAEIASDVLGKQPITSMALVEKSLVLDYSFNYDGNPVTAVVSVTPDKEGKTTAQIDFAGGAYVMTGTATRKEATPSR